MSTTFASIIIVCITLVSSQGHSARIGLEFFKKNFISENGYKIQIDKTNWVKKSVDNERVELAFQLNPTLKNTSATLTIRTDTDPQAHSLEDYVKLWMPKYAQFGLDIINHQYFNLNADTKAFIVDVNDTKQDKFIRQVIFHKDSKAIIFTCMDNRASYTATVYNCNQLISTFTWLRESADPSQKLIQ